MKKILISACLIGDKCRYDGKSSYTPLTKKLLEKYILVPFCPECEGGLKTPRVPSERKKSIVLNKEGKDNTRYFDIGAEKALNICQYLSIDIAILKDHSPSCGVHEIYNGNFNNKLIDGQGVTAELLTSHGIKVISEEEIESELLNDKEDEQD